MKISEFYDMKQKFPQSKMFFKVLHRWLDKLQYMDKEYGRTTNKMTRFRNTPCPFCTKQSYNWIERAVLSIEFIEPVLSLAQH
jgi:hypothetical protein